MARAGSSETDGRPPAWFLAMLVLAVAPLFVAVGTQAYRGWRPVSDDADVAILAHDVLSPRTPLVGMPSTIGQGAVDLGAGNEHAHHPGPMLFWALAVPERVARSSPVGILVGTALVNAAALVVVALVVARLLGWRAAAGTLALLAVLVWALGRQWIVDPLNPYIALLPAFALCTLAGVAAAGRTRALIGVAIVGSFVAQTHLIYAPLAAAMLLVGVAGVAITFWSRARRGLAWGREALITSGISLAALAVAWALPLYDQLAHSPGNLSAVASSFGRQHGRLVGLDWTLRLDVQAIGVLPLFARQGAGIGAISRTWSSLGPLRVISAIAVVLALVVSLAFAVRRRDRIAAAAAATALVALTTATAVVSRVPVYFDGAPLYRILQMWPIGCFVWCALVLNGMRALAPLAERHLGARLSAVRGGAFAVAVGVLAIAPVAVAFADSARPDDTRAEDAVGRLAAQLQPRLARGVPYQVDVRTDQFFIGGAVQSGLLRELARRGFDTRVDPSDEYLGRSHAAPRDAVHLVVCAGRQVEAPVGPGVAQLAHVVLASTDNVDHMRRLDTELHDFVATPDNLTPPGRTLLERASSEPDALVLRRLLDPANDPQRANDGLVAIAHDLVRLDHQDFEHLRAADADAHVLVDEYVFTVYVVPSP
ncbi:MAG: hypothetical protein QOI08_3474 [Actinomycetota bacterium]|nr:hypothetical protein [Actinomycetota bacterium]